MYSSQQRRTNGSSRMSKMSMAQAGLAMDPRFKTDQSFNTSNNHAFIRSDKNGLQLNLPFQVSNAIPPQHNNNEYKNNEIQHPLKLSILQDQDREGTPARSSSAMSNTAGTLGGSGGNEIMTDVALNTFHGDMADVVPPLSARSDISAFENGVGTPTYQNQNILSNINSNNNNNGEVQNLRKEILRLQTALIASNANQKISNKASSGRTLVSGSQFKSPTPAFQHCDFCASMDSRVKKGKENVRILKLQIGRNEDEIAGLKEIEEAYKKLQAKLLSGGGNDMKQQLEKYKALLAEKTAECGSAVKRLQKESEGHKNTSAQLRKRDEECSELHTIVREKDEEIERLKGELSSATSYLDERKKAMEAQRLRYEAMLRDARADAGDLSKQRETEMLLREELEAARNTIEDLQSKLNMLIAEHNREREALKTHAVAAEKEAHDARRAESIVRGELDETKSSLNSVQMDLSDEQRLHKSDVDALKAKIVELEKYKAESEKVHALEKQGLQKRISDLMEMMTKDSESSSKALERAIAQSIRLCVVAPTVNVHVQDKRITVQSQVKDDELHKVITESVVKPYSCIFEQINSENDAPDGSDLNEWVGTMLRKMTVSIEQHVHKSVKNQPK